MQAYCAHLPSYLNSMFGTIFQFIFAGPFRTCGELGSFSGEHWTEEGS
jgi:hypothetical protein